MTFAVLPFQHIISYLEEHELQKLPSVNKEWQSLTLKAASNMFTSEMCAIRMYYPGCTATIDLTGRKLNKLFSSRTEFVNAIVDRYFLVLNEGSWKQRWVQLSSTPRPDAIRRIDKIPWTERQIRTDLPTVQLDEKLKLLIDLGARDRATRHIEDLLPIDISMFQASLEAISRNTTLTSKDRIHLAKAEEILCRRILPRLNISNESSSSLSDTDREQLILDLVLSLIPKNEFKKAKKYISLLPSEMKDVYRGKQCHALLAMEQYKELLAALPLIRNTVTARNICLQILYKLFVANQIEVAISVISILKGLIPENDDKPVYYISLYDLLFDSNEETSDNLQRYENAIRIALTIFRGSLIRSNCDMLITFALWKEVLSGRCLEWMYSLWTCKDEIDNISVYAINELPIRTIGAYFNDNILFNPNLSSIRTDILRAFIGLCHDHGEEEIAFQFTLCLMNNTSYRIPEE